MSLQIRRAFPRFVGRAFCVPVAFTGNSPRSLREEPGISKLVQICRNSLLGSLMKLYTQLRERLLQALGPLTCVSFMAPKPRIHCRRSEVTQIPSRIFEIVQQLKADEKPKRVRVRKVLKWFDASRRGTKIIAEFQETLALAGLDTEPPFSEAGIDDRVSFVLRSAVALTEEPSTPNKSIQLEDVHNLTGVEEVAAVAPIAKDTNGAIDLSSPDHLEPQADESPAPTTADDRPVSSQPHDWTLSTLRDKWNKGQLNLQPEYQREYV
jgi:hypothetical protein